MVDMRLRGNMANLSTHCVTYRKVRKPCYGSAISVIAS